METGTNTQLFLTVRMAVWPLFFLMLLHIQVTRRRIKMKAFALFLLYGIAYAICSTELWQRQ